MKKLRIAYVIPGLSLPGGWRRHTLELLEALRPWVEPLLVVSQPDADEARRLFPADACLELPSTQQAALHRPRTWPTLLASYQQVLAARLPALDLVHSLEAYPSGLIGSWLAQRLGLPHILTVHGTYGVIWHAHALDRAAYRRVLQQAALICPVSHGTARLLQEYFGDCIAPERLQPVLNGNRFASRVPAEEAIGRDFPQPPVLLSVGDLKPRKGQHLSLAAFQQVQAAFPQVAYWIVGRAGAGSYSQHLLQIVERLGLRGVKFWGAVSEAELDNCYRQASLFILTPERQGLHFEGFGLVYLEAGAYGLPVVATRSGGVPDAVRDGETGLLADEGDASGVAQAVIRLLSDESLLRSMGQANRRWAESLTWERTAEQQVKNYRRVLGLV